MTTAKAVAAAEPIVVAVILGTLVGTVGRFMMLVVDYRQYPSYPHGYAIHLVLGLVAGALGAVAVPALLTKDFTAITFLALAAQQFREVRKMERETLSIVDPTELVPRGETYIEGIARVFEARYYVSMLAALVASSTYVVLGGFPLGLRLGVTLGSGAAMVFLMEPAVVGRRVGDIAIVREGTITFDGPLLSVDGVAIMNVGREEARRRILEEGIGVVLEPKNDDARATLANVGLRQAIAHDAATVMGIRLDVDEPEFTPIVRRDISTGRVVMAIVPMERDVGPLLTTVSRVPLLEAAVRRPLKTPQGRRASD